MMYDTDYAIYQYINAQVEQYVEFDDLLKQNHCTMEEAQQEIKAFREKYHSLPSMMKQMLQRKQEMHILI